jgi:hypothetical protein
MANAPRFAFQGLELFKRADCQQRCCHGLNKDGVGRSTSHTEMTLTGIRVGLV